MIGVLHGGLGPGNTKPAERADQALCLSTERLNTHTDKGQTIDYNRTLKQPAPPAQL